jgi:hypothetical protein
MKILRWSICKEYKELLSHKLSVFHIIREISNLPVKMSPNKLSKNDDETLKEIRKLSKYPNIITSLPPSEEMPDISFLNTIAAGSLAELPSRLELTMSNITSPKPRVPALWKDLLRNSTHPPRPLPTKTRLSTTLNALSPALQVGKFAELLSESSRQ